MVENRVCNLKIAVFGCLGAIEWALLDDDARAVEYEKGGPPALFEYYGREIARTMHWQGAPWLMRKVREEEERTSEIITAQPESAHLLLVANSQTSIANCQFSSADVQHNSTMAIACC